METINRKTLGRIVFVFFLAGAFLLVAWGSMIRMPGETYCGPLAPPGEDDRLGSRACHKLEAELPGSDLREVLFPPFNLFKSSTGSHVTFVASFRSRGVVREAIAVFRRTTPFPSDGIAVPDIFPGIGWSDHWFFWAHGYRALLVTDTLFSRCPHTHRFSDTPERLHHGKAGRVVGGVARAAAETVLPDGIDKCASSRK